jgi:dTDP-4-amino-4,6-dideoxygalactose transaminase
VHTTFREDFMAKTIRPVPFLDLRAQIRPLRAELDAAIASVVDQTAFILSDHLTAFERDFAAFCETKHCVGVDSGTQALHLILRTIGVGPGDEVITVPNTFIATLEAIHYTGARPVLVDVDPDTWLMDPRAVARALGPRTRAILPVHLFGHPAPMSELRALADQAGVALVEDACQAHGARFQGRRTGGLGRAAGFSFYPGKNLGGFGDGGAIVTDDDAIATLCRSLRHHGQGAKNIHDHVGYTGRLDSLQAAVLSVKLPRLDNWNAARRVHAAHYHRRLEGAYRMPQVLGGSEAVHHLLPICTPEPELVSGRLQEGGIAFGRHYPIPVHLQPAFAFLGHRAGAFPVAEELCAGIISLPMFAEMTEEMVDAVCDVLL